MSEDKNEEQKLYVGKDGIQSDEDRYVKKPKEDPYVDEIRTKSKELQDLVQKHGGMMVGAINVPVNKEEKETHAGVISVYSAHGIAGLVKTFEILIDQSKECSAAAKMAMLSEMMGTMGIRKG